MCWNTKIDHQLYWEFSVFRYSFKRCLHAIDHLETLLEHQTSDIDFAFFSVHKRKDVHVKQIPTDESIQYVQRTSNSIWSCSLCRWRFNNITKHLRTQDDFQKNQSNHRAVFFHSVLKWFLWNGSFVYLLTFHALFSS